MKNTFLITIALFPILFACDQESKNEKTIEQEVKYDTVVVKEIETKIANNTPSPVEKLFNYHAELTHNAVKYDVLGMGTGEQRTYMVLKTDTEKYQLPVISGVLDGEIKKSWITDLDANGSNEILLYTMSSGTGSYGALLTFEVDKDNTIKEIKLPKLSETEMEGYRGNDIFEIDNSKKVLSRTFPVFLTTDENANPSGGNRTIKYSLKKGKWQVND